MNVNVNDKLGTLCITKNNALRFEGYYSTLNALRPLFDLTEWKALTTGYYLNVTGDYNTVRISYFCSNDADPRNLVDRFLGEHDLKYFSEPDAPKLTEFAPNYGGDELRFRHYLVTYSQIGLDIMGANLYHSQCLFATFRLQVFMEQGNYKSHFAPTFEKLSPFYIEMAHKDQQNFWDDLQFWPKPPQVDWVHMFVNMVLACDCMKCFELKYPQQRLTIPEINKIFTTGHIFQIPLEWNPKRIT